MKTKVIIVDDYRISRNFFELYLQSSTKYEVIASFPSTEDALVFCEENTPDLVLMDIIMREGEDGLSAAEELKKRRPQIKIVLATSAAESTWEERARKAGIEGFWYKEYSKTPLVEILDRVVAGEIVYPDKAPDPNFGGTTKSELTDRELDVLRGLTLGLTNEEIAEKLNISVNTVRFHIANMLQKTGYDSRIDLAINAKLIGLVIGDL